MAQQNSPEPRLQDQLQGQISPVGGLQVRRVEQSGRAEDQERDSGGPFPSPPSAQSLPSLRDCSGQGVPVHPESEQWSFQNSAAVQASLPAGRLQLSAQVSWEGQPGPGSLGKNLEMQPFCLVLLGFLLAPFGKGFILFKHFAQSTSCSVYQIIEKGA